MWIGFQTLGVQGGGVDCVRYTLQGKVLFWEDRKSIMGHGCLRPGILRNYRDREVVEGGNREQLMVLPTLRR